MYSSSLDSDSSTLLRSDSPESTRSYKEKNQCQRNYHKNPNLVTGIILNLVLDGSLEKKAHKRKERDQAYLHPGPGEGQPGKLDRAVRKLGDSVAIGVDGGGHEGHRVSMVENLL